MPKLDPRKEFRPYSWDQPGEIQAVMMTIGDAGCESFGTGVFGRDMVHRFWIEARKSPLTQRWTIIHHDIIETLHSQTVEQGNLSFFDALHYCASFALSRKEYQFEVSEKFLLHYSAAAEAANVPLDRDGMPHPAAWGYILTTGDFDEQAHATAARTAGTGLVPKVMVLEEQQQNALVLASEFLDAKAVPAVPAVDQEEKESLRNKRTLDNILIQELECSIRNVDATRRIIRDAVKKSFGKVRDVEEGMKSSLALGFFIVLLTGGAAVFTTGGLVLLPITALFGGVSSWAFYQRILKDPSAVYQYTKEREALGKSIGGLPEGAEKKLMENFNKVAQAVYALEFAAHVFQKNGGKNLGKGQKALDKMIDELDLSKSVACDLKRSYEGKTFPAPGSFLGILDNAYETAKNALDTKIVSIMKQETRRALPPGP